MEPKKFKSLLLLITFTVFLLFIMINFGVVWELLGILVTVLMPFFVGFLIAYLINLPYVFFADRAYAGLEKRGGFLAKMRKPLALITAYIIVFGVIVFLVGILIPQLVESTNRLIQNFSDYAKSFQVFLTDFLSKYFSIHLDSNSDIINFINNLVKMVTGGELNTFLQNLASTLAPSVFDITRNVTTTLINLGMGIVVSVYLIGCKDKLIFQSKKLCYAYVPQKAVPKVMEIADLSNNIFGKFVYGKILDSMIVGVLCFIGMSILNIEYALLISVIIGITNIIPVFGPFLGAIPSIFILLMIDPFQAIWFTIFILALQQLDGNVIGPKILGNSIGISGFWIMASVIVGGGLFGFLGMLLAVPVFSTFYVLFSRMVNNRLIKNGRIQDFSNPPTSDIIRQKMPKDPRKTAASGKPVKRVKSKFDFKKKK
ncbi:MAG TPA: AI-2E family transporter [Candidatus Scatavimonas merdigallinarum]|uniref:AI-2E family transporter n=1 Tax=Candidatus Scatavimonas merdigallinarum TaxID=2840914 RepID=A0A9D0ZKX9_9FIRM|nr:AI-2E family transporter [Candidatus Scatavimonas merdigallinarum]